MVPSAALASFPLICSPAIPSPLSPVPDGSSAAASMNISMPGLASTTPVFIGTTAVVTPNASPSPSVDPQQTAHPAAHPRPVLARSCSAVKLDSPVCVGHPVTLLKLQQVSTGGDWMTVKMWFQLNGTEGSLCCRLVPVCQSSKLAGWEVVSSTCRGGRAWDSVCLTRSPA